MSVSVSGVITLLILILGGPIFYGLAYAYQRLSNKGGGSSDSDEKSDKVTNVGSNSSSGELSVNSGNGDEKIEEQEGQQQQQERETYKSSEYVFALVGYAIGIGNIWRFSYIIAQNGGSACLVAYLVCLVLAAAPLFLYEMIAGQYTRRSTIRCYDMIRPRWKSMGYAAAILLFIALSYYGMVVAYTFPYILNSLQHPLPWTQQDCGAEAFWFDTILNLYDEPTTGIGPIQWKLALSLILLWVIVYWCVAFGKKILAKITYVTVIMPVVLLVILVARTVVLDGAMDGIQFYIGKFEYTQLLDIRVWATACSQIMFSLSPGFGTAISMSSFTNKKEDVYKACMIVTVTNSTFSIVGGFAIFSMVGHLAFLQNVPVAQIASRSGTGLAFITIAEAMQYFGPFANVMSVLFFMMLFLLGLDSAFAWLETLVSYVDDFFDEMGWKKPATWKTTGVCVLSLLSLGLLFTTRNGSALLDVVDHFVGTIFLLVIVFLESIMFKYDFGWQRLQYALSKATYGNPKTPEGRKLFPKWLCFIDLHLTVPLICGLLAAYLFIDDLRVPYGNYPGGLLAMGWSLLGVLLVTTMLTLWKQDPSTLPPFSMDDIGKPDDTGNTKPTTNVLDI